MKCISKGNEIQRVPNEEANEKVKAGWKFCPKKDWKALRPKPAKSSKAEKSE